MDCLYKFITGQMEAFEKNKRAPSIYTIFSSIFYVSVGMAIKKLRDVPPCEILFFRSIICFFANLALLKVSNTPTYATTNKLHFMIMFRILFGTLAHFCYYQAISMMNLSDAMAIFLTTPIVTTLLASVILKESLQKQIIVSILVSFAGILLIVKPPFLMEAIGLSESAAELSVAGLIICAVFALFESLTNLVIKSIGKQISVLAVIQYVYIAGILFNSTLMVIRDEFNPNVYTVEKFGWIFTLSILNFLAQLIYNRALQLGKTSEVVPITYSQVVMSFLVDIVVFSKEISLLSVVGAFMIIGGNYSIIMQKK
ncbi:hypothetical protein ABPG74_015113 [Tetrahymena malaccensis]